MSGSTPPTIRFVYGAPKTKINTTVLRSYCDNLHFEPCTSSKSEGVAARVGAFFYEFGMTYLRVEPTKWHSDVIQEPMVAVSYEHMRAVLTFVVVKYASAIITPNLTSP